jgi:hypothetical protein
MPQLFRPAFQPTLANPVFLWGILIHIFHYVRILLAFFMAAFLAYL